MTDRGFEPTIPISFGTWSEALTINDSKIVYSTIYVNLDRLRCSAPTAPVLNEVILMHPQIFAWIVMTCIW